MSDSGSDIDSYEQLARAVSALLLLSFIVFLLVSIKRGKEAPYSL